MDSSFLNFTLLCIFLRGSLAMDFQFLIQNQTQDPMDFIIPTLNSKNSMCRNHSLLYLDELSKYTLWAVDMFDSTTKFPSGISYGSIYDTGNFDECINAHIPKSLGFSGQHCMAHYQISSLNSTSNEIYSYRNEEIYNITIWDKMKMFSRDLRKKSRKDIYISYCIPSSCARRDLEIVLQQNVDVIKKNLPFVLDVNVEERSCHIQTELKLTDGDKIFLGFFLVVISFEVMCTYYHLLTKSKDGKHMKFSGKLHDVLKGFSFSNTIEKLLKTPDRTDGLECLNGLKVISTIFVIMGHRNMFIISSPLGNPKFMEQTYEYVIAGLVLVGHIIVDTFFTVSGFLACYYLLVELHRKEGNMNLPVVYLHRIVRLTPSYAAVLAFYMTIFIHLGDGPFWSERIGVEQERCIESWWTNLLYINNYVKMDETCMFHTWYLSCDMQFFLFAPILSYILWKKPKAGIICCVFLILIFLVVNFMVIFMKEEDPFILLYIGSRLNRDPVTDESYQRLHIPGHMRGSPYFIGVLAAYLKFKFRNSEHKISSCIKHSFWIIFLVIIFGLQMTGMYFYSPTENKNFIVRGLFGAALHSLWGVAISWCIIAVSEGYGQIAAAVLNNKFCTVLSKITLTTYLCHSIVQMYSTAIQRYPTYTGFFNVYSFATCDVFSAYLAGFCLTLVIESPMIELEKIFIRKDWGKPTQKTNDVTERTASVCDSKEN